MEGTRRLLGLVFLLIFVFAGTVLAQGMRMSAEERVAQLAKDLGLTDAQKAKVLEILKKSDEKRREAFENADGDREAMRETMQRIRQETDKKLKDVLTEEQFAKYEKLRPQGPPRRPMN